MKKHLFIFGLLFLAVGSTLRAQDLLIKYDNVSGKRTFYATKNDVVVKQIRQPYVKRNGVIVVEVDNFNRSYWKVITSRGDDAVKDQESGLINLFDYFTSSEMAALLSQYLWPGGRSGKKDCDEVERIWRSCYADLVEVKYSTRYTAEEMKQKATDAVRPLFSLCAECGSKDSSKVFTRQDFDSLSLSVRDACPLIIGSTDDAFTPATTAIETLKRMYNSIQNDDYTYRSYFYADNQDVNICLDYYLSDEAVKLVKSQKIGTPDRPYDSIIDAEKDLRTGIPLKREYLKVRVGGGMQFANSTGIGFNYLANQRKEYYMRDSILSVRNDNRVVPMVNLFLNFYPRNVRTVNIGGAMGIGVSLQEELAINYLLGISAVFGTHNRIFLTAGVDFAPVKALRSDYYVGQVIDGSYTDALTKNVYRAGAFISITYNFIRPGGSGE